MSLARCGVCGKIGTPAGSGALCPCGWAEMWQANNGSSERAQTEDEQDHYIRRQEKLYEVLRDLYIEEERMAGTSDDTPDYRGMTPEEVDAEVVQELISPFQITGDIIRALNKRPLCAWCKGANYPEGTLPGLDSAGVCEACWEKRRGLMGKKLKRKKDV